MRIWDEEISRRHGLQTCWVQENQAFSKRKHLIRGLHFQRPPATETKLVRVVVGAILDVFVDLRKNSPTCGQWHAIELSADKHQMLYIPKGFAHGYCTLTEETVVLYKVDANYDAALEGGIRWNDDTLNITWPTRHPYLSPKDSALPLLRDSVSPF